MTNPKNKIKRWNKNKAKLLKKIQQLTCEEYQ